VTWLQVSYLSLMSRFCLVVVILSPISHLTIAEYPELKCARRRLVDESRRGSGSLAE